MGNFEKKKEILEEEKDDPFVSMESNNSYKVFIGKVFVVLWEFRQDFRSYQ